MNFQFPTINMQAPPTTFAELLKWALGLKRDELESPKKTQPLISTGLEKKSEKKEPTKQVITSKTSKASVKSQPAKTQRGQSASKNMQNIPQDISQEIKKALEQDQEDNLERLARQISEESKKAYDELINTLNRYKEQLQAKMQERPARPQLQEIPEPPLREKIDTFQNLNELGKIFTAISILSTTILGLKEKVPEAGLIAFTQMLKAFREGDDKLFEDKLKDWQLQVLKIQDHNQKLLEDYLDKRENYESDLQFLQALSEIDVQKINALYTNIQLMNNMLSILERAKKEEMKTAIELMKLKLREQELEAKRLKLLADMKRALAQAGKAGAEAEYKRAQTQMLKQGIPLPNILPQPNLQSLDPKILELLQRK